MSRRHINPAGPPPRLLAAVAPRFPLVPRPRPRCKALDIRIAQVRDLARAAAQDTDAALVRAAEAHNLAALIVSDCGLPDLARDLCWRQFDLLCTRARPGDGRTAQLALQPIINLARLRIRHGDGDGAYRLLSTLLRTAKARTHTVADGRTIRIGNLISDGPDHREIVTWLWTILLSDGTRALISAGRWADALQHVQQHQGIGDRLLDGRQVAIVAHLMARDNTTARAILEGTAISAPWEAAVAACMAVLCTMPADPATISTMISTYLRAEPDPALAVFRASLGLTVIDLAGTPPDVQRVAGTVVRAVLDAADARTARDALAHHTCRAQMTQDDAQALTAIVRASGLGQGTIPRATLDDLLDSVGTSETAMAGAQVSSRTSRPAPISYPP
jgi:hypothetical protein